MISPEVFVEGFFKICNRIRFNTGKSLDDAVIMDYYDLISEELNDEEFNLAAKSIFRDSNILPSPKEFIDLGLRFRKKNQFKVYSGQDCLEED